jgi:DNA-binding PadR family transcriptional regulator
VKSNEISDELMKVFREAKSSFSSLMSQNSTTPKPARGASEVRHAVVAVLAAGPLSGKQVIDTIAAASAGAWVPNDGQIYPVLLKLVDENLATFEVADEVKVFALTEAGKAEAAASAKQDEPARAESAEAKTGGGKASSSTSSTGEASMLKTRAELVKAGYSLAQAIHAVSTSATTEQQARATAMLEETARALHGILAEEV